MITIQFTLEELTELYALVTEKLDNISYLDNPKKYDNLEAILVRLYELPEYWEDHYCTYFDKSE